MSKKVFLSPLKNAFTLIELLIVVAIIGILAAIAVPNFLNAQIRARIAKADANLNTFVTACEIYRMDNRVYPPHFHTPWQNKFLTTPISYVAQIPTDPFQEAPHKLRLEDQWSFGQFHKDPIFYPDGSIMHDYRSRHRQSEESMARAERGKPWSYETWSVGPNGIVDAPAFIYYETSNGLTSAGTIVWVRP